MGDVGRKQRGGWGGGGAPGAREPSDDSRVICKRVGGGKQNTSSLSSFSIIVHHHQHQPTCIASDVRPNWFTSLLLALTENIQFLHHVNFPAKFNSIQPRSNPELHQTISQTSCVHINQTRVRQRIFNKFRSHRRRHLSRSVTTQQRGNIHVQKRQIARFARANAGNEPCAIASRPPLLWGHQTRRQ